MSDIEALKTHLDTRLDALEQTLYARMDNIRAERDYGDREIKQEINFLREQVKDNTKGIAQTSVEIEKTREEFQRTIDAIRKSVAEGVREAIQAASASVQTAAHDAETSLAAADARIADLEAEIGELQKWREAILNRGIGIGIGASLASGTAGAFISTWLTGL